MTVKNSPAEAWANNLGVADDAARSISAHLLLRCARSSMVVIGLVSRFTRGFCRAIPLAPGGAIVVAQGVTTTVEMAFTDSNYIIGGGAMLTAGDQTSIARATLHAQVPEGQAEGSTGVIVDFDSSRPSEMRRLLILGVGLSPAKFHNGVTSRLIGSGDCDLERLIVLLAAGLGSRTIHWFARWIPDQALLENLRAQGITLVVKPLDCIARAALIIERSYKSWDSGTSFAA